MIQFLLNQELRSEHALDPNLTVLNYLREHVGKPGTKEGCASGDCGACTVVVGELHTDEQGAEQIRYRSLNSCLTFVSSLHGKQLISVEDLKHKGQLHSVQQAMVECHGSQCGFCTPGFVMSLFALQKNSDAPDSHKAHEALAGNLCRCTGYRPILAAAEQACCNKPLDQFDSRQAETIARLKAIAPTQTGELNSGDKRCLVPLTVADLADLYDAYPQARLLAGGTDLALEVTQFHRTLPVMIYVGNIEAMKRIEQFDDRLEIGAATALSDCYAALHHEYPDFGELLQRFASLQIRNQGTLGGNIGNASPIGDSPPLLIALGAQIAIQDRLSSFPGAIAVFVQPLPVARGVKINSPCERAALGRGGVWRAMLPPRMFSAIGREHTRIGRVKAMHPQRNFLVGAPIGVEPPSPAQF